MIELRCAPPGRPSTRVEIGAPVCARFAALLDERLPGRRRFVIADRGALAAFVARPAIDVELAGGEAGKTFAGVERLLHAFAAARLDRGGVVVVIGGGAVGDLGGLAASLWLRGVELAMVPTTLCAMVDSSVGGKTAIDLPAGKNLVGTYWPAGQVWIDPAFLGTLPEDEYRSGLGEVLKAAIGLDAELFALCERERERILARDPTVLATVVERALRAKIRIVEADPTERGPRRLLNLGHTLGHALEARAEFAIPHGVAVARGLHHAVDLAVRRELLVAADGRRCVDLLTAYGFEPTSLPPAAELLGFVRADKKVEGDAVRAILPDAIGSCRAVPMAPEQFLGLAD